MRGITHGAESKDMPTVLLETKRGPLKVRLDLGCVTCSAVCPTPADALAASDAPTHHYPQSQIGGERGISQAAHDILLHNDHVVGPALAGLALRTQVEASLLVPASDHQAVAA